MRKIVRLGIAGLLVLGLATAAGAQTCPPPTPAEMLASTVEWIGTLDLNQGTANSLMQPLTNALTQVALEDIDAALQQFAVFENQVEAQSGKKLTVEEAEELLEIAAEIVYELTAPPCVCYGQAPDFTWMIDNLSDLVASGPPSCEIKVRQSGDKWLSADLGEAIGRAGTFAAG